MKEEYIAKIMGLLQQCQDYELFEIILKLLQKSS